MGRPEFKMRRTAHFGLGAFLAICAAGASIACSVLRHWGWGLGLAAAAILLALAAFAQPAAARKRGGAMNFISMAAAIAAVIVAAVMLVLPLLRRA